MANKKFDPLDFKKQIINGVPVYSKNLPWANSIYINVIIHSGALADEVGKEGTAHLLEHMTLRESKLFPKREDFWKWSKKYAFNQANAFTGLDRIVYILNCLPKNFKTVLTGWQDIVFHPFLEEKSLAEEKQVVMQEAWRRYDNQKRVNFLKKEAKNIFHDHPHARFSSPLGWPDTIPSITREDLVKFHQKNFGVGNISILLVGKVTEKEIADLKNFIKGLPKVKTKKELKQLPKVNPPLKNLIKIEASELGLEQQQAEIEILVVKKRFPISKMYQTLMTRDLLREILFREYRTKHNLCYTVAVQVNITEKTFYFSITLKTSPQHIAKVRKIFKTTIQEFQTKKYQADFFETKKVFKDRLESQEDISSNLIGQAQYNLSTFGEILNKKNKIKQIQNSTYKDIQKFIKETFGDEKQVYINIILPNKETNAKK